MINSIAVLQSTANVASVAMKVNQSRYATSFLFWMTDEIRMEGNLIASFYVDDFKGQSIDLGRWNTSPMGTDVGIEE